MLRQKATAIVATLILATACSVGDARSFRIDRDLTGLDLAYMRKKAKRTFGENSQTVDGQIGGFPFWFLPAVSIGFEGTSAQHHGPTEPGKLKRPMSPITGFDHTNGHATGLGLLNYGFEHGEWNADGKLQSWDKGWGLGWGLLYSTIQKGDGARRTAISTKLLSGLFGYSEDQDGSYLHLLWIPIGIGGADCEHEGHCGDRDS